MPDYAHARKTIASWAEWKKKIYCSLVGVPMNLIEKLKTNERPYRIYADMTPEEQGRLEEVGPENLEYLTQNGTELAWWDKKDTHFSLRGIYRIKPNYKPQPEDDDKKIAVSHGRLCVQIELNEFQIHELPSLPGFRGFWQADMPKDYIHVYQLSQVAEGIAKGEKVIARFER